MPNYNQSASAKSALPVHGSDIHVHEAFSNALARGLDKVWKRDFMRPKQGRTVRKGRKDES